MKVNAVALGTGSAYSFLRVPWCAVVVKILVPGYFSHPVI
jgi:hypothetical protein